jgi:hypothetical protein
MSLERIPITLEGKDTQKGKVLLLWSLAILNFLESLSRQNFSYSFRSIDLFKSSLIEWVNMVLVLLTVHFITKTLKSFTFILTELEYVFEYKLFSQEYSYVIKFSEILDYSFFQAPGSSFHLLEVTFKAGHTGKLPFPFRKLHKTMEKLMQEKNIPKSD